MGRSTVRFVGAPNEGAAYESREAEKRAKPISPKNVEIKSKDIGKTEDKSIPEEGDPLGSNFV